MERIDNKNEREERRHHTEHRKCGKRSPATKRKTLMFGFLVLAFGVTWLLTNLEIIPDNISKAIISWPSAIIAVGLINLVNGRGRFFGALMVLAGGFFLSARYIEYTFSFHQIFWPSIIIIIGIAVLFGSRKMLNKKKKSISKNTDGYIEEVSIFSGHERKVYTDDFQGGEIVSIFGGSELDLTRCELKKEKVEIELIYIFGGSKIVVPSDWNVVTEVVSIFGGFADKRYLNEIDTSKTVVIKGFAIFGGGEITNR